MITIDRAIEVIAEDGLESGEGTWEEYLEAIQLGREALKLNKTMRETYAHPELLILPGETEG